MNRFFIILQVMLGLAGCKYLDNTIFSSNKEVSEEIEVVEVTEMNQNNVNPDNTKLYQVLKHDTVASVSNAFNTTPEKIIQLNDLKMPYTLKPGDVIVVPIINYEDTPLVKRTPIVERKPIIIAPRAPVRK